MTAAGFPQPVEVRHERGARRVVIEWDDGHRSAYPLDYLRSWCPCALCQGHQPVALKRRVGLSGSVAVRVSHTGWPTAPQ